jgi:hypothetical protein
MKLGTETGSVMNHVMSRQTKNEPEPVVGMGVTMLGWTDRYAGTIHRIFQEKGTTVIEVTDDDTKLVSGSALSEEQEYEYTPCPDAKTRMYFMKDKRTGKWQEMQYRVMSTDYDEEGDERNVVLSKRLSKCSPGKGLKIGVREEYRDPSF